MKANAKVNLALRVGSPRDDGLHPLWSLVQSISWSDDVSLSEADEDHVSIEGADIDPEEDLAWRAVRSLRDRASRRPSLDLRTTKSIPVAAGLGGGSADAAAALVLGAGLLGVPAGTVRSMAPDLGADVPFCLSGGTAVMEGIGERLTALPTLDDAAIAIVVPPFELSTAAVYRRWDELDEPEGPGLERKDLPVSLRDHAPLVNDLTPAAMALSPELGDWIADLRSAWGQPVAMSGSGPALFGLFPDETEASDAAAAALPGARATAGVVPVDRGWDGDPGGTLPPPPWGVV